MQWMILGWTIIYQKSKTTKDTWKNLAKNYIVATIYVHMCLEVGYVQL